VSPNNALHSDALLPRSGVPSRASALGAVSAGVGWAKLRLEGK